METKLNKVDLEIRQGINEKTASKRVHRKEENIIRDDRDNNRNFKENTSPQNNKTMLVDAKIDIEQCKHEEGKGLLLDRTL